MALTWSLTKSLTRPLTRGLTAGRHAPAGGFLAETSDYIARVEALSGSFDLSATVPALTEPVTKLNLDAFIRATKGEPGTLLGTYGGTVSDVWSKLTEAYTLAGVTFAGIPAKLKYASTATLTNNNFVSGDLVPAGAGAGLVGNGTTKWLNPSAALNSVINQNDAALSAYITALGGSSGAWIGMADGSSSETYLWEDNLSAGNVDINVLASTGGEVASSVGHLLASRTGSGNFKRYQDGGSPTTVTTAAGGVPNANGFAIFARNTSGANKSNARLAFAHIGTGLTDDEAAYLSWCVNGWATLMGFNTYANP